MSNQDRDSGLVTSKLIIIYELIHGFLEFILGLGIILLGRQLVEIYQDLLDSGFLQGSHRVLSQILEKSLPFFFNHQTYVALLFIAIGLVKVISGIGLIYKKPWAGYLLIDLLILLIPLDIVALADHLTIYRVAFIIANVLVVSYLMKFNPKTYFMGRFRR